MLLNWYCRRLLRVAWTVRRSNQSILKEINPKYSLKGLMLKLKLQFFGHLMQRTDSLEKTLMLVDWRQKEKGVAENEMVGWHHWLNGHEFEQTLGDSEGQESLVCCSPWGPKEWNMTEQLNSKMLHRCLRSNGDRVAGASFSPFLLPRSLSHTTVNVCYSPSLSSVLYGEPGHLCLHQSHMVDMVFALQMRKRRKFMSLSEGTEKSVTIPCLLRSHCEMWENQR